VKTAAINLNNTTLVIPVELAYLGEKLLERARECTYCGAGEGIGDLVVPEHILGCRVTLACLIHDKSWDLAEANWADFHQSNGMFIRNMNAIINEYSANRYTAFLRRQVAAVYFDAVESVGARVFADLKGLE